ncbi:hypothetical protein YPPY42_1363, partial [Yersinia pestis PY-42]
MVVFQPLAGR